MKKLNKTLSWLNTNLLFVLSTFLIAFIPLFPKIPLFDILPGYIVRVRVEDFLILFAAIIWLRDAGAAKSIGKKKFQWNTSFFWLIVAYAAVGLISILLSTTLLQSIPAELLHIGKSGLHFFRYMEYFALFFFLYSSVRTKKHIKIVLTTLAITLIGIVGYGFGQQYLHFPLYSTMNREYSKGQKLYLQENARPQSTFAGHYDLGAYLVIILPIIFALSIIPAKKLKKKQRIAYRLFLHSAHLLGAWMLVTSGSKTALAAYLSGVLIVLFFYLKKLKNIKQQLKWGGISLITLTVILGITLTIFGQETKSMLLSIAQKSSVANKIISKIPGASLGMADTTSRPEDLYGEGHEFRIEIETDKEGNQTKTIVPQESIWSKNALKYGISMGIRLDSLWPQAIKGLINNPLFGNGYATLSKTVDGQFTEADSTDNNFLRTLGETGILGFITFYGLIIFILTIAYKNTKNSDSLISTFNIGFAGSIIGLLINATYIDVFAASKVAFTFWALAGLSAKSGLINLKEKTIEISKKENTTAINILNHFKKHRSFYIGFLILFFLLHKNPYKKNSLIRDFETSDESIELITSARCYIRTGSFTVCRNNNLVLKDSSNLYSFLLVPFLKTYSDPATFYYLNFTLLSIIFVGIYKVINKIIDLQKNVPNPNFVKFTSLLTAIFIFYATSSTSQPLTTSNLLILIVLTPILTILMAHFTIKRRKNVSVILQAVVILFIASFFLKTNLASEIKTNFRNNKNAYKNSAVERLNIHFREISLLSETKDNYLISNINPYYFDFYKDDTYKILPMSENQSYFNKDDKVWTNLSYDSNGVNLQKTYQDIISNDKKLYITDYGIYEKSKYLESFNDIKKSFDLINEVIDCDEQCNIYSVSTPRQKISDIPKSINQESIDLTKLSKNFSFSILSNDFTSKENSKNITSSAKTLINNLKLTNLKNSQQDLMIFTGNILHKEEKSWQQYFDSNFGSLTSYPIIYSKNYHKFFSENNYFIFLSLDESSKVDANQKLFVYNAFLELEKLPNIKNIFIVAHNLDWQNTTDKNNFIHNLERKLFNFPSLNKYIITSNQNEAEYSYKNNQQTKAHYFANLNNSSLGLSYIQFDIDENSNTTFKEVSLDAEK